MFSQARIYLQRALRMSMGSNKNFINIRDLLKAAQKEVMSDPNVDNYLKQKAYGAINDAVSYTYARTNPGPPPMVPMTFSSMTTPISPFQKKPSIYGMLKLPKGAMVPREFTQSYRETDVLLQMIRRALAIVSQGL